jgi:hypothetical protein
MVRRQAVLLIHGIGEQKPMDTLRRFVDSVWRKDTSIHHAFAGGVVWSKPDDVSDSYELRRLTTPRNAAGIRTDFFEFYWAHLMEGTSYGHVLAWARSLLVRSPATVPAHLRRVYWLIIILLLIAAVFAGLALVSGADAGIALPAWTSAAISLVLLPVVGLMVRSVVGDAARYLDAAPGNVQRRHAIRHAGISLLNTLHARGYDRIIVVGHSLGSVIGYDILTHAWVGYHDASNAEREVAALDELETMGQSGDSVPVDQLQAAQRRYLAELSRNGNAWRVTDFLTLGSPLAHAEILLARDAADLGRKQTDRELPTCPPTMETVTRQGVPVKRFSFGDSDRHRLPHHAAVFAATRWTNLYFPSSGIVRGDLIGGPLRPLFGSGIRDVEVRTSQRSGFLSHTLYWVAAGDGEQTPQHIAALRAALDLTDTRAAGSVAAV